ncbi:hypothetical protein, partial [Streptomyces sp. OR43]|uniref:hypothetical protein n=1 Tax=Streptomyces sp. or43 TaxID=2478957 RepID=UPI0016519261
MGTSVSPFWSACHWSAGMPPASRKARVPGGASLFSEKTYLVGKFARVALKTRHVDYNGRLCMVSAAGANKLAFGIDRA